MPLFLLAQKTPQKTLISDTRTVVIELASVEQILLKTTTTTNKIKVGYIHTNYTNTPTIFEKENVVYIQISKDAQKLSGVEKTKYRAGQPLYPSYIIEVPKDVEVQLLYDKGNFLTEHFYGDLDIRLNSGDVTINQFKGTMNISTYSGKIDVTLNSANIFVENSKGDSQSNLQDKRLVRTGTLLKGVYRNASNMLKIRTVTSKITLNSAKE